MNKSKKQQLKKMKIQSIDESHFEGLMSSMRHARNQLLFFTLFCSYSLLSILGTTDKMMFMELPVKMPLLNIELPLLSFFSVMPLFLIALQFNLLYIFSAYREFLITTQKQYPMTIHSLPIGIYEGALLKQDRFNRSVRFAIGFLLYVFPVLVLTAFWFRFADYQSFVISAWHFIAIIFAALLSFYFRGIMYLKKRRKYFGVSVLYITSFMSFAFLGLISSYAYFVIYPISKKSVNIMQLENLMIFEKKLDDSGIGVFLKREEWFLPRITIRGEVLVPINKEQLEVIQEIKPDKNAEPLLFSIPAQNRQKRYFRLAILNNCVLPNTNFRRSEFQKAELQYTQLQNANFEEAQLQGAKLVQVQLQRANLKKIQFQKTELSYARLEGANLEEAQLQKANLYSAQLQRVSLLNAQLQEANLHRVQLQGASLRETQMQGSNLQQAQLQGADLQEANLQGAVLIQAQLQGTDLRKTKFQGAVLMNAQLQGANLGEAKFQGAFLMQAQLQGAISSNTRISFNKRNSKKADVSKVDSKLLTKTIANNLIANFRLVKINSVTGDFDNDFYKSNLYSAVGKKPFEYLKKQREINLGVLTKDEYNEIAQGVTDYIARRRMGLESLKSSIE